MKITRDIHKEIALQESKNVERWISSSVCEARISQFNELRQRELAMFLDCPSVYADSDPVADEGLNYQIMSAEERVGDVFSILGGSSILHNARHLSALLVHPKTLCPIYNFVDVVKLVDVKMGNARVLQKYLDIASTFASRYTDEFLWVRSLLVHRALLTQEAVRTIVGVSTLSLNGPAIMLRLLRFRLRAGQLVDPGVLLAIMATVQESLSLIFSLSVIRMNLKLWHVVSVFLHLPRSLKILM